MPVKVIGAGDRLSPVDSGRDCDYDPAIIYKQTRFDLKGELKPFSASQIVLGFV